MALARYALTPRRRNSSRDKVQEQGGNVQEKLWGDFRRSVPIQALVLYSLCTINCGCSGLYDWPCLLMGVPGYSSLGFIPWDLHDMVRDVTSVSPHHMGSRCLPSRIFPHLMHGSHQKDLFSILLRQICCFTQLIITPWSLLSVVAGFPHAFFPYHVLNI